VRVGVKHYVREDYGVVADSDVVADDGVGTDVGIGADAGGRGDGGGGVNARGVGGRLVEELDGAGEGEVGVFDAESCGRDLGKAGFDEDRRGFGGAAEAGVFGVGDEGKVAWDGVFDAGDSGDLGGGVALEGGA